MVTTVRIFCRVCNNPFRGRLEAQYCSGACRRVAFQHRRKERSDELPGADQIEALRQEMQEAQQGAEAARQQLVDSTGVLVKVTRKMHDLQQDMIDDYDDDDE